MALTLLYIIMLLIQYVIILGVFSGSSEFEVFGK